MRMRLADTYRFHYAESILSKFRKPGSSFPKRCVRGNITPLDAARDWHFVNFSTSVQPRCIAINIPDEFSAPGIFRWTNSRQEAAAYFFKNLKCYIFHTAIFVLFPEIEENKQKVCG